MASSRRIDFTINGHNNAKAALTSASNDVKKLAADVKSASSKMTMQTGFNKIVSEARAASSKIKEFFNGLGGAIASAMAGFSLASIMQEAGAAESKWNRIAVATGATAENLQQQKVTVRAMADQYGVVNGEVSKIYETNLRFYGDQQRSLFLTKGIAATSKRTGTEMETIQQALLSGELGRNKALQRSVLTEQQRNKYLADGELTQEEINAVMQENIDLVGQNVALTEDAESAYARMQSSIDSMVVAIGSDLAPVITKMAGAVTWLANGFKIVDNATGGILGAVTGIVLAAVALGAPLAWAGGILMNMARSAAATATSLTEAAVASKAIGGGAGAAGGAGAGAASGALATGATIAGLIGAAGALTYGLGEALKRFGEFAAEALHLNGALKDLLSFATEFPSRIMSIKGPVDAVKYAINSAKNAIGVLSSTAFDAARRISAGFYSAAGGVVGAFYRMASGARGAIGNIWGAWSGLRGYISQGVTGVVNIFTNGLSSAWNAVSGLYNYVRQGATGVVSTIRQTLGFGPARGPASEFDSMDLNYESYGGMQKSAWTGPNSMSGNCVDMSLGLIQAAGGGSLVSGTWNGGPHVWANIGGRDYDPARKALEGTWTPPARGPGDGGSTYVFNGPVYNWDEFKKQVSKANDSIIGRTY